jgi:hypothetical protein
MRKAQHSNTWNWLVATALATAWVALAGPAGAQPHVWSGLTFEFVKPDNQPPPFSADAVTASVSLTRGSERGLYNALLDSGWNGSGPTGTEWATEINNPGATIEASNYAALDFMDQSWLDAYGGGGVAFAIEGTDAVVHLIEEDVYLDLRFTHWQSGGGGGFVYLRAEPPAPTGDYNGDLIVNAADYTVWRNTLGQAVGFDGAGADGDGDRMIDYDDFLFWRERYGDVVGGAGASADFSTVPEPSTVWPAGMLAGVIVLGSRAVVRRRPHGMWTSMIRTSRYILWFAACTATWCLEQPAAAATVWSGPITHFSRLEISPIPAANYDQLTGNVGLTRGTTGGMFNVFQENLFNASQSPRGTAWATDLVGSNGAKTVAAANWQELEFTTWTTAYGGSGLLNASILAKNAVVHLIQDDIYLDLRFTHFGPGGAFAYDRSTPVPEPDGILLAAASGIVVWARRIRTGSSGVI